MHHAPPIKRNIPSGFERNKTFFNASECDAVIESSDGYKIYIDTLYLAQYSDFFKCAFYGINNDFMERKRRKIRFETISYDKLLVTFNLLKRLTSNIKKTKKDNKGQAHSSKGLILTSFLLNRMSLLTMLELLDVAAYLQIELLLKELSDVICQRVTTQTLLSVHLKAEKRYPPLANRLWRKIVEEFSVLVKTGNFIELSAAQMVSLLKDPKLNLDPSEEFSVVTKWLEANYMDFGAPSDEITQLRLAISKAQVLPTAGPDMLPEFAPPLFTGASNCRPQFKATTDEDICGIGFYNRPRIPQHIFLAVGGWATGGPTNQLEFYEPNRRCWMPVQLKAQISSPQRRAYHSLVCKQNSYGGENVVYVIGGYDGLRHHKSILKFDLDTANWIEVAPMNEQRCYVSGTIIDDNHLIAVGGFNEDNRLRSAEIFDIERNQWSLISSMNCVRSDADCVSIDGRIYAVGGFNGFACHDSCEVYDPVMNIWTQLSKPMRFKRSGVKAICATDHVLVVVGGFTGAIRLKTPEFYDSREGIWHMLADMDNKRSNFGINTLDSRIIVCGGYNNVSTTNLCEAYDWRANAWTPMPEMAFSRSALAVCRIDRHPIIERIVEEYDNAEKLPLFA